VKFGGFKIIRGEYCWECVKKVKIEREEEAEKSKEKKSPHTKTK